MNTRFLKGAALALLTAALGACAPVAPRWEKSFGDTVRASVASQVANPAAVRNTNPVAGLDGRAAEGVQAQYEHSFSTPTAQEPAMLSGSGK
jgi:hypothetical protein